MARRYMPILPDSSGRNLRLHHTFELVYSGAASETVFSIGDTVIGETSLVQMTIGEIFQATASAGTLIGILAKGFEENSFTDGENLQVSAITKAQANGVGTATYNGANTLMSFDNPTQGVNIDALGQMFIRSAEGPFHLDALGRTQFAPYTAQEDLSFVYDLAVLHDRVFQVTVGSGAISTDSVQQAALLSCSTISGDKATLSSVKYYRYRSGISSLAFFTLVVGDTGKANVRRRWGYFDDDNGVFFELDGTTLYAVYRSDSSGSIVDTRVAQASWNRDELNGEGGVDNPSALSLDLSTVNQYFIDLNHGVRARLGIYSPENGRFVGHNFALGNVSSNMNPRAPQLPLRIEQENTSGSASTSEIRVFSMSKGIEGDAGNHHMDAEHFGSEMSSRRTITSAEEIPLLSLRAATGLFGKDNHRNISPVGLNLSVTGTANADYIVRIREDVALAGASWTFPASRAASESDIVATGISDVGDELLMGKMATVGDILEIDFEHMFPFDVVNHNLQAYPDNLSGHSVTVTAQMLDANMTGHFRGSLIWSEVQ